MRNLVVHTHSTQDLSDENHANLHELLNSDVLCCTNPDNDDLYVLSDKSLYQITSIGSVKISKVDINVDDQVQSKPVGLEYSSDVCQLWCAYASGNIVAVNAEPELCQDATNHIQGGLKCIKLSPDQEILVSITNDDTVVTSVSDFHIVSQVDLNAADYGKNQFITVGWGKKETQFHGTEGKAAAKAKAVVVGKTEDDDGLPRITWRGDGSMFAVSFLQKDRDARLFKVFNREGVLQCTSELTNGLEPHISWKPSGNLIATSQLFPNKHVIAFFEKNGLKHRELCLPFKPKEIDIISIQWSYDSDVLTIWLKDRETENTSLELWTENNYHWYLKQTIKFTKNNPLLHFTWSGAPRAGKRLLILSREKFMIYTFRWAVNHGWGTDKRNLAPVGVIDGTKILYTCFGDGIVPPPMAHQIIELDKTINSIIFEPRIISELDGIDSIYYRSTNESVSPYSRKFFCHLSDNRLVMCAAYSDSSDATWELLPYEIVWDTDCVVNDNETYTLHHFLWLRSETLLCSATSSTGCYLCLLSIKPTEDTVNNRAVVSRTWPMDGQIEHIVSSPWAAHACVIVNKRVLEYRFDVQEPIPLELEIPESCYRVELIRISNRNFVVSLTSRGRFFIDGNEAACNITSFAVHSDFLLLTTMQHTLISVKLDVEGFRCINDVLMAKTWENNCPDKNSLSLNIRRVERGSNLIIAIPGEAKTILQMPRGNLECIQPRALSLHIIGARLDNLDYAEAFDMMRKQRINLNLIYDHNPSLFTKNAKIFVEKIDNPAWLSLFLSELQDNNVMESIYKNSHRTEISGSLDPVEVFYREHKVERVCELLRTIMESQPDADRFIQPILTSLVKNQRIPGLEAALRKVKEVRNRENLSCDDKKREISSEEALKYLLYLVNVDVLFDIAMGMYDFELALFVASKSQKDPKEYIPVINTMKKREENFMKFSIDKHLKRYNSALVHITKAPNKFPQCLEFISDHNMYARALKIYPRQSDEYREIAKLYGHVLMKSEKYYEAGIMFTRSKELESAVRAFKAAGSWQDAIVVGTQLNLGLQEMQELYQDLVSHLSQDRKYCDAAEILVTYLKQHEDAVSMLCEGKQWRAAMRIAYSMKRLDLIETHVKPGVQEHAGYMIFKINKNREDYDKQRNRLAIVRQEKAARDLSMQESLGADCDYSTGREVSDLLSDTSSIAGSQSSQSSRSSKSSGRTYRSSKNRRKQERKGLSVKEGSLFEDLALRRALHILVSSVYADKNDVKLVIQMLLIFDLDDTAEKLKSFFGDLLSHIDRTGHEIWPKSTAKDPQEMSEEINDFKENQRGNIPQSLLEPCFMYPPEAGTSAWQKDIFHQSATN